MSLSTKSTTDAQITEFMERVLRPLDVWKAPRTGTVGVERIGHALAADGGSCIHLELQWDGDTAELGALGDLLAAIPQEMWTSVRVEAPALRLRVHAQGDMG